MTENLTPDQGEWRSRLADDMLTISSILVSMRRIAVLGIKTKEAGGPAYTVPAFLQARGFDIVPVPVYFPTVTHILDVSVHRSLDTIHPPADLVQIFRRPEDLHQHVDQLIAAAPRVVWMQLGIQHAEIAEQLARSGIHVIQNRCLQVELTKRDHR